MDSGQQFALGLIATYMFIVLVVGVWVGRRSATSASWQFGAGGLSVTGICAMLLGTRIGATATVGLVEDVYNVGIVAFSFVFGQVLGSIICGFTTGRYFYRSKMMTMPAFMYMRLGKRVTILGILIDVFIGLAVNGIQVLGVALIIRALTGLDLVWGIMIGSFLGWIYLTLGGITATAATNFIHLGICFVSILLASFLLFGIMPLGTVIDLVPETNMQPFTPFMTVVRWTIVGVAISLIANIYHSPLATARSEGRAILASVLTGLIYGLFGIFVMIMGLYAIVWAAPAFEAANGRELPGRIAFGTVSTLLGVEEAGGSAFGGIVGLLVMAGVIGAIISTMAPLAWAISTILSRDVYRKFIRPDATDKQELFATRVFSTVYWLVPGIIGYAFRDSPLLAQLLFLLELPVGGVFAVFLCFYWSRVNEQSAFYTLLTSVSAGILHRIIELTNPGILEPLGPWFGSAIGWIVTSSAVVFFLLVFLGKRPSEAELEVVRRARLNLEPLEMAPGKKLEEASAAGEPVKAPVAP